MRKSQQIRKPSDEKLKESLARGLGISFMASGLASIVLSLLGVLLSLYVSPAESPTRKVLTVTNSLLYFVGGVILLGIVIVAIGSFVRRKNREVILLRRRISEIYLLALRKSALNPQPHITSND